MKRIFIAIASLLISNFNSRAQEIASTSKISDVTVYRTMAKETRTLEVTLPKGNTDIIISGVTMQMIDNSIQVAVKGDGTLLTASVRVNYFNDENPEDKRAGRFRDSIKILQTDISWINEQKSVFQGEIALINANLKLGTTQEAMKPADLDALADIFRKRLMDLKKKIFDLTQKESHINERIAKFSAQLNELGPKQKEPVKEIVLAFSSEIAVTLQLKCMYLVNSAGWAPMYDIRVLNTTLPVSMDYKAKIFQKTGVDWKNVLLSVSTANPGRDNNRPVLVPKYIDYVVYERKNKTLESMTGNQMLVVTKKDSDGEEDPFNYNVTTTGNEIMVEFRIDARQSIPSDGKEHICKLQTYKVPAVYKYHAVPRLDQNAFLLAKITDYGQYNLLAGAANIFFDDMYIGQVQINPQIASDTLLVSLGRDERIVVRRTQLKSKSTRKLLANSQKDTFVWETVIRNNKGQAIEIEVLDEIPLSRRKEIVVELLEKDGAEYTEATGRLLWNIKVKPNESKKIKLSYSVEYPTGREVQEQ